MISARKEDVILPSSVFTAHLFARPDFKILTLCWIFKMKIGAILIWGYLQNMLLRIIKWIRLEIADSEVCVRLERDNRVGKQNRIVRQQLRIASYCYESLALMYVHTYTLMYIHVSLLLLQVRTIIRDINNFYIDRERTFTRISISL